MKRFSHLLTSAVVGDVIRSGNGSCALALTFPDTRTQNRLAATDTATIREALNGKTLRIAGNGYVLETVVGSVTVATSLAGFRNIFIEIAESDATARICENDRITVL